MIKKDSITSLTDAEVSKIREERAAKTKMLLAQPGHPLSLFTKENEVLQTVIETVKNQIFEGKTSKELLEKIQDISTHYAKKGDLLYPILKVHYEISGPSDVMWTTDDEIRDEMNHLEKTAMEDEEWKRKFEALIVRIEKMMETESHVLFPNCAYNFSEEEWFGIYHDQKDYPECFGVPYEKWEIAEDNDRTVPSTLSEKEVVMAGGHMTIEQLTALLNTIPLEITFVDTQDINRFFNEGPKDFKRPQMAIDREVYSCHPPKVEEQVRHIIQQFRAGTLDELPIWMEKNGKCMLVKYMAVRDKENNYIGTLELVQNMDFAKEHFLK